MIDPKLFDDFKTRVRGPLLLPGQPGYDDVRSVWNGMIDRRPAAVLRCLGVADVVAGVTFARERGVRLSIKGGGHNISGLAVCDGGLMLDMSLMRGVWVDEQRKVAHAQAGCLLGDVDRETQARGLASVLGFVSNTGIAWLTLGGGFGYLSRQYGWTSDTLLSVELVTAEGRIVRASDKDNPDLFWGLRGGGGNFGVATNFEYRLYPLGPEIIAGAIAWRGEEAAEVLEMTRTLMAQAPPELTCIVGLRNAPPAPWLPAAIHGKPIVALFVCYAGPIADGEKVTAPIKSFRKPVGDIVQRRPYVTQQSMVDAANPKGRRYYWKSEYLGGLEPDLLATVARHGMQVPSPHSAILLAPVDGGVNRLPEDHSAVGNRKTRWLINIASSWEAAPEDQTHIEWTRGVWRDTRSFSTGGTYVNFLTEEEGAERIQAAYGANLERLVTIKTKWDPQNLFRVNKNIVPR